MAITALWMTWEQVDVEAPPSESWREKPYTNYKFFKNHFNSSNIISPNKHFLFFHQNRSLPPFTVMNAFISPVFPSWIRSPWPFNESQKNARVLLSGALLLTSPHGRDPAGKHWWKTHSWYFLATYGEQGGRFIRSGQLAEPMYGTERLGRTGCQLFP